MTKKKSCYSDDRKQKSVNEVDAYKFSDTATEVKPNLGTDTIAEFLAKKYDRGFSFGSDGLQSRAVYRLMGWSFDFAPYLKRYVYKQYGSWYEIYAPNKTSVRTVIHGRITEIVEVK